MIINLSWIRSIRQKNGRRLRVNISRDSLGDGMTWMMQIVESFEDEMLRILCVAAVVSLVLGIATEGIEKGWLEGTSILVAVVIIVTVTSGNNWIK